MLKSMTGFGRCENATDEYKISVEMKAVNHRYLDLSIKMPKKFNYFEAAIRTLLKKYIQRGKVDLFINYEDYTEGNLCLKYNKALAGEYMDYFKKMEEEFGIRNDIQVSTLSRCPEVLTMEQVVGDPFCSFGRGSKEICCIQRGGRCSFKRRSSWQAGLYDRTCRLY